MTDRKREGWQLVRFGDVVREINQWDKEQAFTDFARCVRGEDIDTDEVQIRRWGNVPEDMAPTFGKIFRAGQVLYHTRSPNLRKYSQVSFDGYCGEKVVVLETKDENVLMQDLIAYILQTEQHFQYALQTASGSTNKFTSWKKIANYEFLLPPPQQQRELVALMQGFEAALEAGGEVVAGGQLVFTSLVEAEFNNPPTSIPFTDLCTLRNGLNFSGDQRGTEGVRVIDINAIPTTGIFPDQSDLYSVNVEASDKDLLQDGDLLIIRSHANKQRVGTTVLVEKAPANTSFSGFLIRSRPDTSRINSKYLTYFMRSRTARQQIVKGSGGTNINNINRTTLSQVEVPFFPLERQVEIVSLVDVAANQIDTANKHISELRALRSSILNTALTPSPVAEAAVGVRA